MFDSKVLRQMAQREMKSQLNGKDCYSLYASNDIRFMNYSRLRELAYGFHWYRKRCVQSFGRRCGREANCRTAKAKMQSLVDLEEIFSKESDWRVLAVSTCGKL